MPQETLYTQYPDVSIDSRVRYFDGQFLGSQDFADEQRYHVDRARRLAAHLRIAGVTEGLTVSAVGPLKVNVAPGTAVDAGGRQIVLVAPRPYALPADVARPGVYVVAIRYGERVDRTLGGRDDEPGTRGDTRFNEDPLITLFTEEASIPATDVPLARLAVAADGTVTVTTPAEVRRYSGLRLPGPDGPRLTTGGDPDPTRAILSGALTVQRDLVVAGYANVGALHVRARGFKVAGAGDKFYPVVFVDNGWTDGALELELTRASVHADREWWGSLVARLRVHASRWGNGADFDELEVFQSGRRFVARNAVLERTNEVVVWLRGDTTYQWRSNHACELVYSDAAETTRSAELLPVLAAIDAHLDRDRVYVGPTREDHVFRIAGATPGWDRLVVGASSNWGDGGNRYATLGAGVGAAGIMFHNAHVSWVPGESRASIRYGRVDSTPGNTYWDVGVRADKSFSFVALDGGADGAERLKITHNNAFIFPANVNLTAAGRLHISGEELLYVLNKAGVVIGKEWGGSGNLTVQGTASVLGDLLYNGRLNRLDTMEQGAAYVRVHDFLLGHSGRRGQPGRALVDNKTELVVNFGKDWPRISLGSPTDVVGDLTYSGQLNKLDTMEQGPATVRAADFLLGHSTRRGQPGRAFVDGKTELIINYGVDWPKTAVHGPLHGTGTLRSDGAATFNAAGNALNITHAWTGSPDAVLNVAEISNDAAGYKTLMIIGNRSAAPAAPNGLGIDWPGVGRRVSVWDRLEVNGHLLTQTLAINLPATTRPAQQLHIGGRMAIDHGVIQRGGDPITNCADLGLYSQVEANWLRYVSKNGSHVFFNDGGIGTTPDFSVNAGNSYTRLDHSANTLTVRASMRVEGLSDLGRVHRRAASFNVPGDGNLFYPVVFNDVGWADGPCTIEISRANVHTDRDWWGSLEATFTFHNNSWGHGAEFDEVSITQTQRILVGRYGFAPQNTEFVVWLRGNTTYFWRSNHRVDLATIANAEITRGGATFPVLTKVDDQLNMSRYSFLPTLEAHTFRLANAAAGWDRIVLGSSPNWGDNGARYATIGTGNAGIMFHNPHVSWISGESRASIRYGRTGGTAGNTWWDVGVRADKSFSFIASEGGADGAERLKITADNWLKFPANATIGGAGRLHVTGEEILYILNKSGVVIGREWGGNGNLSVQGATYISSGTLVLGAWTLQASGTELYFSCNGQTVARLSTTHDRFLVFRNVNGAAPYFYFNSHGATGVYNG